MALNETLFNRRLKPLYEPFRISFRNFKLPSDIGVSCRMSVATSISSSGILLRPTARENIPINLIGRSRIYPLSKIALVDIPAGIQTSENPTEKQVVRYTNDNGGELVIYLSNLWSIARDYVSGDLMIKNKKKWWVDWVKDTERGHTYDLLDSEETDGNEVAVDEPIEQGNNIANSSSSFIPFEDDATQHIYAVWQHLIDSLITNQAALSYLTTSEALYKKTLGDHEVEYQALKLLLLGSMGILASMKGIDTLEIVCIGLLSSDGIASYFVNKNKIEKKVKEIQSKLQDEIGDEPLIKVI